MFCAVEAAYWKIVSPVIQAVQYCEIYNFMDQLINEHPSLSSIINF
jgi:hypothetical protein